jgi:hypothetical protein
MTDIERTIEEARAAVLPFESWERLPGESAAAFAAFCAFRDFGAERNIRRAAEKTAGGGGAAKRYRAWRGWAAQYKWRERAADYDQYLDRLRQAELRKTIEEQGKAHRAITGKMLRVVEKKLDLMDPADLAQGTVTDWVETAIRADREAGQFADANCPGVSACRNPAPKDGQIAFIPDFEGL